MMTYDEHLVWCKRRALEYLNEGDVRNAVTSMLSDLNKHKDTPPLSELALVGMLYAINNDAEGVRRFIEGFR
jgi:hypothetical protein